MISDSEEPDVAEETPSGKPKLSIVVILSVLLGILLTLGVGGALFHFRESKALQAQVRAISVELENKNLALDEMKTQIEALSSQMHVLKEHSIARSGLASEKDSKKESTAPALDASANALKSPGAKAKTGSPEVPAPPKVVKPKPAAQNCELVGKSPEDQAATLRRCVSLLDPPTPKEKPLLR